MEQVIGTGYCHGHADRELGTAALLQSSDPCGMMDGKLFVRRMKGGRARICYQVIIRGFGD